MNEHLRHTRLWGLIVVWVAAIPAAAVQEAKPASRLEGVIRAGADTTRVTGPLTGDGLIDYVAVVNERIGQGIAPEKNAAVPLYAAIGPRPEGMELPDTFYQLLQTPRPPDAGDYLISLNAFRRSVLEDNLPEESDEAALRRAERQAWTRADHPLLSDWVDANEIPLKRSLEAAERPEYFAPLFVLPDRDKSAGMIAVLLPGAQRSRDINRLLVLRATRHLGSGEVAAAWDDLHAALRLARLTGRGPTLIEYLVGMACESAALQAAAAVLEQPGLDDAFLQRLAADLDALPERASLADKVDETERFMFLDVVQRLATRTLTLEAVTGLTANASPSGWTLSWVHHRIDWNRMLRRGNDFYDRLTAALRLEDRDQRSQALQALEAEIHAASDDRGDEWSFFKMFLSKSDVFSRQMETQLLALVAPALSRIGDTSLRADQRVAVLRVGIALARYRNRQGGTYPLALAALQPEWLAELPRDEFSRQPLIYRRGEQGCLVYSVGLNGVDNGGWVEGEGPAGDDLAVRLGR